MEADNMEIKDRIIRIAKNHQDESFIVDEYGIKEREIYHRHITISKRVYEEFEKNPDGEMQLEEFLKRHHIDSRWNRYEPNVPAGNYKENDIPEAFRLFVDLDVSGIQGGVNDLSEQTKTKITEIVYSELSRRESLINNPYIMDVFNEALREDPALRNWESAFPFFR